MTMPICGAVNYSYKFTQLWHVTTAQWYRLHQPFIRRLLQCLTCRLVCNLRFEALTAAEVQLRLLDAMGRMIQSAPVAVSGMLNMNLAFDKKLSAGIYFIEILDGGVAKRNRFVVE